jgi:phage terminase large subunit-like protein
LGWLYIEMTDVPTNQPPQQTDVAQLLAGLPSLADDITREVHKRSFYAFFKYMWPELEPTAPYIEAIHTKVICDHLQAVYEGLIPELSIEIGPGYGKSFISAVAFPAWIWACRDPGYRIGFSTYAEKLTVRDSNRFMRLIKSELYQQLYGHVFSLRKEREDFQENNKGGYRVALSVTGQATGYRFNLWMGDDLLNYIDSLSEAKRQPFKEHFSAISTRGQIGKPYYRVNIGQRLGEDDPGNLVREMGFQVLCLPTEYDPSRHCETFDVFGKRFFSDWRSERGQLLFPAGFGPDKVAKAKLDRNYTTQHNQLAIPADGGIIKLEYLQFLKEAEKPQFSHFFASVDTAQGQNANNDKTAVSIHGVHNSGIHLEDGWTGRKPAPQVIQMLKDFGNKYEPSCFVIEQKDWGKALTQLLENDPTFRWRIEKYTPVVSKDMRAHEASPLFFKGQYSMTSGTPLAEQARDQLIVFPASKARDLADCIVQAALYAQATYTFGEDMGFEYEGSSADNNNLDEEDDEWQR